MRGVARGCSVASYTCVYYPRFWGRRRWKSTRFTGRSANKSSLKLVLALESFARACIRERKVLSALGHRQPERSRGSPGLRTIPGICKRLQFLLGRILSSLRNSNLSRRFSQLGASSMRSSLTGSEPQDGELFRLQRTADDFRTYQSGKRVQERVLEISILQIWPTEAAPLFSTVTEGEPL